MSISRHTFSRPLVALVSGAVVMLAALPTKAADGANAQEMGVDMGWPPVLHQNALPDSMMATSPRLSAQAAEQKGVSAPLEQQLQAVFANRGLTEEVPVIIGLKAGFVPEGLMSATRARAQREQIQSVQNRVIEQLTDKFSYYAHKRFVRFGSVPYLATRMTLDEIEDYLDIPEVESIQLDHIAEPLLAESKPLIGADTAQTAGFDGTGQYVAVLDTGVESAHPFLQGKVVSEACYSNGGGGGASLCPNNANTQIGPGSAEPCEQNVSGCDHGTHVAGIVHGVAPESGIIAINVFTNIGGQALSYSSDQIKGLERVLYLKSNGFPNIASVNMSLGGGRYYDWCNASNSAIKAVIDNLRAAGIATIIASGNNGYADSISAPACVQSAIAVGSTGDGSGGSVADRVSYFSNSASMLALLAPGQVINSSVVNGQMASKQGTSMAAPHVAAAWAIAKSIDNSQNWWQVKDLLQTSGQPIRDIRNDITTPRVDLEGALLALSNGSVTVDLDPADEANGAQWRLDGGDWKASGATESGVTLSTHSVTFKTIPHSDPNRIWITPNPVTLFLDLDTTSETLTAESYVVGPKSSPNLDLDSDGRGDLIWRNQRDGSAYLWTLDGTSALQTSYITRDGQTLRPSVADWTLIGPADADGDGHGDLLWRNTDSGALALWTMDGANATWTGMVRLSDGRVPSAPHATWQLGATADFNGDGKADVVWRNRQDGTVYLWLLDGATVLSHGYLKLGDGSRPRASVTSWHLVGASDVNMDGKADVLWQNTGDGGCFIWEIDGASMTVNGLGFVSRPDSSIPKPSPTSWVLGGFQDADGDGDADLLWRSRKDGSTYLWLLTGRTIASDGYVANVDHSIPAASPSTWLLVDFFDTNGDGRADAIWRNKKDGSVYIWILDGLTIESHGFVRLPNNAVLKPGMSSWSMVNETEG